MIMRMRIVIMLFSFLGILLVLNSCEKHEIRGAWDEPEIIVEIQNNSSSAKSGQEEKYPFTHIVKKNKNGSFKILKEIPYSINDDGEVVVEAKNDIVDGNIIVVYGAGKTFAAKSTSPTDGSLIEINWDVTFSDGDCSPYPRYELGLAAITGSLPCLGDYNIRGWIVHDLAGEWEANMTIMVLDSPDQLNIVSTGSRWSEWIPEDSVFMYNVRINKPAFITPDDVLFRITEQSGYPEAEYGPIFNGITVEEDSLVISFPYPANGLEDTLKVRFIAGRMGDEGDTLWFNANPDDPLKATVPEGQSDIFEISLFNGLMDLPNATFPTPGNIQPGMGDHGEDIPVALVEVNEGVGYNFYVLSQNATHFRYKEVITDDWTVTPITNFGGGRFLFNLPFSPASGEHYFDWGWTEEDNFIQCPFVALSSMWYSPSSSLQLSH